MELFEKRSNKVDYGRLDKLCFIGRYDRRLPVSINRMMENAYDWEHLPHVHQSSFQAIDLKEEGAWGWRAVATSPDSRLQHIELLVDRAINYWATTILSGDAKGFEIHTQANEVSANEIDVQVSFYLPKAFSKVLVGLKVCRKVLPFRVYKKIAAKLGVTRVKHGEAPQVSILNALHYQYSVLYDEDEALMGGRQQAIDRLKNISILDDVDSKTIGTVESLMKELPKLVQFGKHRYVVNRWKGEWVAYGADCPHRLGPLEASVIDKDGRVTCPWHGYQFDIITGDSCQSDVACLKSPPNLSIVDNDVILSVG